MISYRNINVAFRDKTVLKDAGLDLKAGKATLVCGPSGSGKTTLFYRLAFIMNNGGAVIENRRTGNTDRIRRQDIAFVMQNNELMSYLTVEENLYEYAAMAGARMNEQRIHELLHLVNLDVPLDQKCSLLSLGERERLCIACALSKNAKLIILDEPTASLDKENKLLIFQLIRRIAAQGKYVVYSSHEEQASEYADDVYRIKDGKVIHEKESGQESARKKKTKHDNGYFSFLKTHIAHYRHYNRILQVLNASFILIAVICSALVMAWYKNNLDSTRKVLFESSDKYLYITDSRNEGYADKDTYHVLLDDGYPVYSLCAILDKPVYVIPYYEETDYSDKVNSYLSSQPHGIYLSQDAADGLRNSGTIQQEVTLKLTGNEGIREFTTVINGILKQGVKAYELYDEDCYIAMWHEDYEALSFSDPVGRLKLYNTYEQLEADREKYLNMGYTVNDKASSYEHVLEITQKEQTFFEKLRLIFLGISAVLLAGMHVFSVKRRIREFTILRINGIPAYIISLMLGAEQLPALLITIICGLVVSCVMNMIGIPFTGLFALSFMAVCMICAVLFAATALYLSVYRIDKVLRD